MESALSQDLLAMTAVGGRVCLALIFLLAAFHKMRHWSLLFGVISNYRLLPQTLVAPATMLLPVVELGIGLGLLSDLMAVWVALAAMAMLLMFATAIAINVRRGRTHIDCGCGQSFLKQGLSPSMVGRNVILAGLLLPCMFSPAAIETAQFIGGVCTGLSLTVIYFLFNALFSLPKLAGSSAPRPSTV